MTPSRRGVLGGAGLVGLFAATPAAEADEQSQAFLQTTLERYFAFGEKASGGAGDQASGAWLEEELGHLGYVCRRQAFEVPFFEVRQASLMCGQTHAAVIPQAIVAPTGAQGLSAPLRLANRNEDLAGAIALVELPHKRWTSLADPQVARPLEDALRRGAAGVVLITTGPTGEAIALNVSTRRPQVDRPVAILAPKEAAPFLAAAAQAGRANLTLDGQGGRRPAFNLIAHLDRKAAKTLVISTPRSGWFGCAAERGSGLAIWLWLARELAHANPSVNVELLATSGHEYEYLGGEHYLSEAAPSAPATQLWVHIGASAAARDWHELGARLLPLPSAETQRVLTATPDVLDKTRLAFRGIGGLEATYEATKAMAGGELINVINSGYKTAIGLYGAHRYFHTRSDDLRCVSADLVLPVATAFWTAIGECLGQPVRHRSRSSRAARS